MNGRSYSSGIFAFRMAQMPETLMGGDEALDAFAPIDIRVDILPRQHPFQNHQQLLGNFVIILIAGVMECDQDFVGQPTAVAYGRPFNLAVVFRNLICKILN